MAVVCDNCKTENRDHAMFCRGCTAKLPAFAATGPSALAALGPLPPRATAARPQASAVKAAAAAGNPARFWLLMVASVVTMVVAFAGWYAWVVRPVARTAVPVAAAAPPPMSATRALPLTLLTPVEPPATVAPVAPVEATATMPPEPAPAAASSTQRVAPSAPAASRPVRMASAAVSYGGDPRSACSHLNFIAAARCEAAQCDKAAYSRHPRCDVVRAQGRRDEARRNPLMAN